MAPETGVAGTGVETLLIDAGNSMLKWAWRGIDGSLNGHGHAAYAEDLASSFRSNWSGTRPPAWIVVANVRGETFAGALREWCGREWGREVEFPLAGARACGVRNAYREPARLGIDRWAAIIAAHSMFRAPLCVFDLGTAITADAIDAGGAHLGGLIVPGVALMRASLSRGTEGLIEYDSESPSQRLADKGCLLGDDTESGVSGGTLYAAAAFIERVIHDLRREMGTELICVLTGGDAERTQELLELEAEYIPDLVLRGLALLANHPQEDREQ